MSPVRLDGRGHPHPPKHTHAPPGLGYDYETALAVSPLQRLLCYARAGAVLTGLPPWAWRLGEEWLVPLAEGLGYKVRARCVRLLSKQVTPGAGALGSTPWVVRGAMQPSATRPKLTSPSQPRPHPTRVRAQATYPQYSTRAPGDSGSGAAGLLDGGKGLDEEY